MQDRLATAEREQLVSKQEEPVALSAPRPALPAVGTDGVCRTAGWRVGAQEGSHGHHSPGRERLERPACRHGPAGGAGSCHDGDNRHAAPPRAQGRHPRRSSGAPLALEPQAGEPAAAQPARPRVAAIPPSAEGAANGFVVQLSSQKTESEAQSSFRSLQAKFPNELGGRQPLIRRADLGSKGVFYRTMIGPFASAQEASQFCATYKAAGGQCVVPNN